MKFNYRWLSERKRKRKDLPLNNIGKKRWPLWLKIVSWGFGSLSVLAIAGILFIKLNTSAAADFTDNVLRPIIGDAPVIALEKFFFNASDALQRAESKNKTPQAPQFVDTTSNTPEVASHSFDLVSISPTTTFKPLVNEGIWKPMPLNLFPGKTAMAYSFVRPDQDRNFTIVTLLRADTSLMRLSTVAGTKQPGGPVGKPGPGKIPSDVVAGGKLLAAFDGGFQYKDGAYGMIVGNTTYLPLQNDLGTVVGYKDGSLKMFKYTGQDLGPNVEFIRQNCPILVDNGEVAVNDAANKALWGRTPTTDIYTWRSGMGLDKNGNLIFAVGNNVSATTLGVALKMAGAQEAIQLDINPNWVRFNIFQTNGNGTYKSTTLTHDLKDGSTAYLNGYEKDFFYLYGK